MQDDAWYWSLSQHKVVRAGEAKAEDVLGPYATRDEAEGALDHVRARNDALAETELKELAEKLADEPADERERRLRDRAADLGYGGPLPL